jgi:hypothetical protein
LHAEHLRIGSVLYLRRIESRWMCAGKKAQADSGVRNSRRVAWS